MLMSNRFRNFKEKNNQFNLSCPYCGDSTKNKFKARGYLITKKGAYYYYCHNCSISKKFDQFINDHDPMLYREYKLEKLKDSSNLEKTEHTYRQISGQTYTCTHRQVYIQVSIVILPYRHVNTQTRTHMTQIQQTHARVCCHPHAQACTHTQTCVCKHTKT